MKLFLPLFFFISISVATYAQYEIPKPKQFSWKTPTKGDYGNGEIDSEKITDVEFFGAYRNDRECDYSFYWKCFPQNKLFEKKNGTFTSIKNEEMFNEKGAVLLKMINDSLMAFYKDGLLTCADCFTGMEFSGGVDFNSLTIYFKEKNIEFTYYFDLGGACDACAVGGASYTWEFIMPYLKNQTTATPNYCTPSGPKVNIRSDESVNASILFQLDRGVFFEILNKGKTDKVNGKDGHWYQIDYEGKKGNIFSFYTLCP